MAKLQIKQLKTGHRDYLRRFANPYSAVAFVTGFVLMAFEMIAARLLAPSVGTSVYVWTSVIGVMIAALAIGYAYGGWLADRRAQPADIGWLLMLSALAITGTLLASSFVLSIITGNLPDPRSQGVAAAMILFLPASFLIGMISPYLAKMQVQTTATTGTTIAGLSALNSLGGISGTFITGFGLFSWIGSRTSLGLLIGILVFTSWLMNPLRHTTQRLAISLVLFALTILASMPIAAAEQSGVSIDSPTSHYSVETFSYSGRLIRGLVMGPGGIQSAISEVHPNELALAYTSRLAQIIKQQPHDPHMLILGGGAFTLPEYLARQYPNAHIDVVEIDPALPEIAKQYFDYNALPNVTIYTQDARQFINQSKERYDTIIVDVYSDFWVPFSLTTYEYTQALKTITQPDGSVLVNIIGSTGPACLPYFASVHRSYSAAFANSQAFPVSNANLEIMQNIILVYSNAGLEWTAKIPGQQTLNLSAGKRLTDDFAPVEPLLERCTAHET